MAESAVKWDDDPAGTSRVVHLPRPPAWSLRRGRGVPGRVLGAGQTLVEQMVALRTREGRLRAVQSLARQCKDWAFERSKGPGLVAGGIAFVAAIGVGLGLGGAVSINWVIMKGNQATNLVRAIYYWDADRFFRPMSFQDEHIGKIPEIPMETVPDKHVPWWMRVVARRANCTPEEPHTRRAGRPDRPCTKKHWWAKRVDDWLAERARHLSVIFEVSTWVLGLWMHLPFIAIIPAMMVIDCVPLGISSYVAWRNHDLKRLLRPGHNQRSALIADRERRLARSDVRTLPQRVVDGVRKACGTRRVHVDAQVAFSTPVEPIVQLPSRLPELGVAVKAQPSQPAAEFAGRTVS